VTSPLPPAAVLAVHTEGEPAFEGTGRCPAYARSIPPHNLIDGRLPPRDAHALLKRQVLEQPADLLCSHAHTLACE
jgi:hypothetical protein